MHASHLAEVFSFKKNVDVIWKRHSNTYSAFAHTNTPASCHVSATGVKLSTDSHRDEGDKKCTVVDLRVTPGAHLDGYVPEKRSPQMCTHEFIKRYDASAEAKEDWFDQLLDRYAAWHRDNPDARTLVYVCLPFSQCGGHGDRINGILTLFLLAIVSKRRFLILSSNPVDLEVVFATHRIDWRMNIEDVSVSFTRSYIDRRHAFQSDIRNLIESPDHHLLLRTNMRRSLRGPNHLYAAGNIFAFNFNKQKRHLN